MLERNLLLLLMIWLILGKNGVVHSAADDVILNPLHSIAAIELNAPTVVLPLGQKQRRDNYDRALDEPSPPSASGIQLIGWAGPGSIGKTLSAPPPNVFPKWIPDFQPVKEKHWDAIVGALATTQNEPPQTFAYETPIYKGAHTGDSYSPFQTTFSDGQFKDSSNLESYFSHGANNKNTIRNRNDVYIQGNPSGLIIPESFNPFEVYLPGHLRRDDNQLITTNNRREYSHQNSNDHTVDSGESNIKKTIKYVTWPNIGEPNARGNTVWSGIRQLTKPLSDSRKREEVQAHGSITRTFTTAPKGNERQWPDLTNAASSPAISLFNTKEDQNLPKTKSWPNLRSKALPTATPILSEKQNDIDLRVSSLPNNIKSSNKSLATLTPPPLSQKKISSFPTHNLTKIDNKSNRTSTPVGTEAYKQPWLHAAVQHDLKEWGYPYDKDAPPNPYKYNKVNIPLQYQNSQDNTSPEPNPYQYDTHNIPPNDQNSHSNVSPKPLHTTTKSIQKEKPSQSSKAQEHFAIVEVDQSPLMGPIPIKNIHVIAPKPDEMPPVPVFRPLQKIPLQTPPYLLPGNNARSSGTKKDPILVLPYPPQINDDDDDYDEDYDEDDEEYATTIYPVLIPLTVAQDRQGTTTLDNLMKPFRSIFQLGPRESRNNTPNKPKRPFKRQIPATHELSSAMQPPPLPTPQPPDFGPPKGDDIVFTPQSPQQSNENGIPNETSREVQANQETSGENTFTPLLTQNQNKNQVPQFSAPALLPPQGPQNALSLQAPQVVHPPQISPPVHPPQIHSPAHPPRFPPPVHQPRFPPPVHQPRLPQPVHPPQVQNEIFSIKRPNVFRGPQLRPPPPTFKESLPPVLGTVKEDTSPITLPTTARPSLIPWPNLRTTPAPPQNSFSNIQAASTTTQTPFNIFNQPPTPAPFRLPNLSNMRFLNPFNMFRSRENTNNKNNNGIFSWFPSLLPQNDANREKESPLSPRPNHGLRVPGRESIPQSSMKDVNTRFLRHIRGNSSNKANSFLLMPHLPAIFPNKKPRPPIQNIPNKHPLYLTPPGTFSLSPPLVQSPLIRTIPQDTSGKTRTQAHNIQQPSTGENFLDDTIFIVDQKKNENGVQDTTIVHPQTNPARVNTYQHNVKEENVVPHLIKFTIDDVLPQPDAFYITNKKSAVEIPHPSTGSLTNSSEKDDLYLAPSGEVVTVAQMTDPDPTVPPLPTTPTSFAQFKSLLSTTQKPPTTISPRPLNTNIYTSAKPSFPSRISKVKPHFQLQVPVTTSLKFTTNIASTDANTTSAATTTTTTTSVPFSFSKLTSVAKTPGKIPSTAPNTRSYHSSFQQTIPPSLRSSVTSIFSPNFRPFTISLNKTSITNHFSSTATPTINPTTKKSETKPLVNVNWRFSHPEDTGPPTIPDNQGRSKTQNYISAASSRITIIEATPMPQEGEVFPTVQDFQAYIPKASQTTTTVSSPVQTESTSMIKAQTTSAAPLPRKRTSTPLTIKPKNQEVLMPGSANHRSMTKLPNIEYDSMINTNSQPLSRHRQRQASKFKIKYNNPPRKIFHAHGTEPTPTMETSASSVIPKAVGHLMLVSPTGEPETTIDAITQASTNNAITQASTKVSVIRLSLDSQAESKDNTEFKSSQEDTTPEVAAVTTHRPLLAGRPSRYNSLQRLRDFMASKRKKTTPESSTIPAISPSSMHTTQKPKLISTTMQPTTSLTPLPFTAYSTQNIRKTITNKFQQTTTTTTTTAPITRTTTQRRNFSKARSPWHKQSTTSPPQMTTPSHITETLGFKQKDYEPTGSHSSFNYKWRPPIHDVDLQDHPEMFDIYNWESTRVGQVQERADPNSQHHVNSDDARVAVPLQSDTFRPSPKLVLPMEHTQPVHSSLRTSHLRRPRSTPVVVSKSTKKQFSSSNTQVQRNISSNFLSLLANILDPISKLRFIRDFPIVKLKFIGEVLFSDWSY